MGDPSYALQKAVYEALVAASAVPVGRVLHRVPDNTPVPFIHIGDDQIFDADDAGPWSECFVTLTVFASNKPDLKVIVGHIRTALETKLTLEGFGCEEWNFERTTYATGPDGLVEQAQMEFRYLVQPFD